MTISTVCSAWLASPIKAAGRTTYQDATQIATYVAPSIGPRDAATLTRAEARAWLKLVADGEFSSSKRIANAGLANRLQTLLTCAFDYAIRHDKLVANPFRDQDRLPTKKRERYFDTSEIAAIWRRLDDAGLDVFPGVRLAIKLQMLSGTRANEWTAASWIELDLNDTVPRLVIPASRYKTKVAHLVPIAPLMRQQLELAKTLAGSSPWVFPGRHTGKALRRTSVTDAFARTCERAGVKLDMGESTHVLRHTVETHLRRLQVAPHIVDGVLGHVQLGMRATYNHWHAAPEKLEALAAWEAEFAVQ